MQDEYQQKENELKAEISKLEETIASSKDHNAKLKEEFTQIIAQKEAELQAIIEENEKVAADENEQMERLNDLKAENSKFDDINEKHKAALAKFHEIEETGKKQLKELDDKIKKLEAEENSKYDLDRF